MRIEGLSNYSKLHFTDGKTLIVSNVLHWFEDNLPADGFTGIHKSHLINRAFICGYLPGCTQSILLKDNSCIQVARRKQATLRKLIQLKVSA